MPLSTYPLDVLLRKRRSLRRDLLTREPLKQIRIAILGGTTTFELVELLDLLSEYTKLPALVVFGGGIPDLS